MELREVKIKIGELFQFLNLDNEILEDVQFSSEKIYIKNLEDEIVPIQGYVKKRVNLHKYVFESGRELKCSDKHIVLDEFKNNILIKDTDSVQTLDGVDYKISDEDLGEGFAYDISIPYPHLYFTTNGIIHHNTTLTRIMSKGHDVKVINCSGVGIDAVRQDIQTYASQYSLEFPDNPIKIVVLEECDGFTQDAWKAMRATVEQYSDTIRFIANCNYIEKVPDPIRSRFTCIQLEPLDNAEKEQLFGLYFQRSAKLLQSLGITFTEDTLKNLINDTFPDYRSVINKIQQIFISGVKELSASNLASAYDFEKLFNIILNPAGPMETYKLVRDDYYNNIDDCVTQIGTKFPEYLEKNRPDLVSRLPKIIVATAQHQDMLIRAMNRSIVLLSLIYTIQGYLG